MGGRTLPCVFFRGFKDSQRRIQKENGEKMRERTRKHAADDFFCRIALGALRSSPRSATRSTVSTATSRSARSTTKATRTPMVAPGKPVNFGADGRRRQLRPSKFRVGVVLSIASSALRQPLLTLLTPFWERDLEAASGRCSAGIADEDERRPVTRMRVRSIIFALVAGKAAAHLFDVLFRFLARQRAEPMACFGKCFGLR